MCFEMTFFLQDGIAACIVHVDFLSLDAQRKALLVCANSVKHVRTPQDFYSHVKSCLGSFTQACSSQEVFTQCVIFSASHN